MSEISLNGVVFKYTNFLFGYQERYFKLHNGTIYYFLSRDAEKEGCRKYRALSSFKVEVDQIDQWQLDIVWTDGERWSLRFHTEDEFFLWRDALEAIRAERDHHLQQRKSVRPAKRTRTSRSSGSERATDTPQRVPFDRQQVTDLQQELTKGFEHINEVLSALLSNSSADPELPCQAVETTAKQCRKLEEGVRYLRTTVLPSVQLRENVFSDDEWHDANGDAQPESSSAVTKVPVPQSPPQENADMTLDANDPPLMAEVRRVREQELKKARAGVGESDDGMWELFVEDGALKMYKMEVEVDGVMCDPLKAVHTVNGVSAWEFIDIFFRPELKPEWDHTLERMNTIEVFNDDLAVIHQIHKRVWPSSQRESLFWSFRSNVSDYRDPDAIDAWMVTNHDTERNDAPLASSSNIRVQLTVGMYCQTVLLPSAAGKTRDQLTRSDIATRVAYIAQVHPGGWAPTAILRQIYKSEYPKFLREFTAYVLKKVKDQPVQLS